MNFLLDTNIVIPLEPGSLKGVEPGTQFAAAFLEKAHAAGLRVFIHPLVNVDLNRDKDADRLAMRKALLVKYSQLPDPPQLTDAIRQIVGNAEFGSNAWVDDHMLASVIANAVDYLVTEDAGIHNKARRLQIEDRVLYVAEARSLLADFFDQTPRPPPAVESVKTHALDETDEIFDSIRSDYPGFDEWLNKCKREHRQAWLIRNDAEKLAGFCIVNREPYENAKTLKICTFKISPSHNGNRFGELLLKTIFNYAFDNGYERLFVTAFPEQKQLIEFFRTFGF